MGNTSIGNLTFETAAYTARYVTKKLSKGQSRYVRLDSDTGEIIPLVQPFAVMSLRSQYETPEGNRKYGGIAKEWFDKYHKDIYNANKDSIHIRGKKMKPTKYYDALYDKIEPEKHKKIKQKRTENIEELNYNQLRTREKITRARTTQKTQI